tara:strand:+ start:138 stop:440 length:303 start_codon:yes stop_codon:yes gene_type:complete
MHIGLMIRNMGDQSTREIMAGAALAAEDREFESIWVVDHIAIPPEDSEGSGGRYVDILTSLAWLAGFDFNYKIRQRCFNCSLSGNLTYSKTNCQYPRTVW